MNLVTEILMLILNRNSAGQCGLSMAGAENERKDCLWGLVGRDAE